MPSPGSITPWPRCGSPSRRLGVRTLKPTRGVVLLCLLLGGPWAAAPASAREGWEVRSVSVRGLPSGVEDPSPRLQLTARPGFLGGGTAVFRGTVLEADLRRLQLHLAQHGYPYARIMPEVRPDDRASRVTVVFQVHPGRPVRVADVQVRGAPPELPEARRLAARILAPGRVFTDALAERARVSLAARLAGAGYLLGEASLAVERPDSFTATAVYTLTPGLRQRIVLTEVSGVSDDLADLAVRTMSVPDSVLATPALLERARDNLRELQLFRQIRLGTTPAGDGALVLGARLAPAAPRTARVSLGTWSDDPIRVRAGWQHRNLFRRGRGLGFRGSYSPYRQELGGRAWWPALAGPRSVAEVGATWLREDEESYTLSNRLLETALLLRPAGRLSLRLGASLEDVRVEGTGLDRSDFDAPDGRMLVLAARLHDDRSDDLLEPTRGTRLTLDLAWSPPGALSVSPFASLEATAAGYMPLPGGLVLATRVAAGSALPLGEVGSLQPNRRFFAGGVTTMRGAKRRRLGPLDDDGDPVGGEARLLAAAELRAPLTGLLGLTAFFDSGQVWADRSDLSWADLTTAAGGGVVIRTPVGPVRADAARLLRTPRAGEPRTVIHLSIGHPF